MSPLDLIRTPGIKYTATRLAEYADKHGVDPDQAFMPAIDAANDINGPGSKALRLGYGLPPFFEVSDSVPRTIPIVLARLAIFDSRLNDNPTMWPPDMDARFGVFNDSVRWLRLLNVKPNDEKVDEILSIVGANSKSNFDGTEQDERDNTVSYTGHYFMESDKYAIKVVKWARERHLGARVTGIEFMLPDRTK